MKKLSLIAWVAALALFAGCGASTSSLQTNQHLAKIIQETPEGSVAMSMNVQPFLRTIDTSIDTLTKAGMLTQDDERLAWYNAYIKGKNHGASIVTDSSQDMATWKVTLHIDDKKIIQFLSDMQKGIQSNKQLDESETSALRQSISELYTNWPTIERFEALLTSGESLGIALRDQDTEGMFKSLVVTDSLVSFSVPQFLPRTPIRNTVQFETLLHALEDTKNAAIIMLVPMTDAKEYANMDPELMQEVFGAVPTYMAIALYVESNQTRLDVVFTDEKYAIIDMTDFTDEIKRTITQLQLRFQGTGVDLPNIQVHTLSNKRLQITVDASLHGIVSDVLSVYTAAYLE